MQYQNGFLRKEFHSVRILNSWKKSIPLLKKINFFRHTFLIVIFAQKQLKNINLAKTIQNTHFKPEVVIMQGRIQNKMRLILQEIPLHA